MSTILTFDEEITNFKPDQLRQYTIKDLMASASGRSLTT